MAGQICSVGEAEVTEGANERPFVHIYQHGKVSVSCRASVILLVVSFSQNSRRDV